jgi:predicted methyltransferase
MVDIIKSERGKNWIAYHGDTVDVARGLPDYSVDFSVFSPPFASLYTYSNSPRDMGNCRNREEFFAHYEYLIQETKRVMKPGRNVAIHCMLLPTSKERDGHIGLQDFRGDIIRAYERHGFSTVKFVSGRIL